MSKSNISLSLPALLTVATAYTIGIKELWGKEAIIYISKFIFCAYALVVLLTILALVVVLVLKWRE